MFSLGWIGSLLFGRVHLRVHLSLLPEVEVADCEAMLGLSTGTRELSSGSQASTASTLTYCAASQLLLLNLWWNNEPYHGEGVMMESCVARFRRKGGRWSQGEKSAWLRKWYKKFPLGTHGQNYSETSQFLKWFSPCVFSDHGVVLYKYIAIQVYTKHWANSPMFPDFPPSHFPTLSPLSSPW